MKRLCESKGYHINNLARRRGKRDKQKQKRQRCTRRTAGRGEVGELSTQIEGDRKRAPEAEPAGRKREPSNARRRHLWGAATGDRRNEGGLVTN